MSARVLALGALAVVTLGLISGCSARLPDPATVVKAASEKAEKVETVSFDYTATIDGLDELDFSMKGKGGVDVESDRSWMEVDSFGETVSYRTVNDKTYSRSGDSEPWYEEENDTLGGVQEFFTSLDPDEPFKMLEDCAELTFTRGTTDKIRGATATQYTASFDPDALTDDDGFGSLFREDSEGRAELWVYDSGLPARLVVAYQLDGEPFGLGTDDDASFEMTMEFFDYGQPVDVEAPSPDQITENSPFDLDDIIGGAGGDPFAGADCYADRVADCLEANTGLDSGAADATLCQGAEARVCLVPVGNVRADIVDAVLEFHRETKGIEILVLPSIPMTADWVSADSQVTEERLYKAMQDRYGVGDETPSTFIAITPIDIAPEDGRYGWMFGARFGEGFQGLNHGVFSYFRMVNVEPYDGRPITDALIHDRASKYVGRYVALLHLDYPMVDDIEFLNYSEMGGFSVLDTIGTTWPTGPKACEGDEAIVCIVPDGIYDDFAEEFTADVRAAAERLTEELGLRVEVRNASTTYFPTLDSWSEEFHNDLTTTLGKIVHSPNITVIGITDDPLSQASSVPQHLDRAWPSERLAIVSSDGAGATGSGRTQERIYRLLYRAVAQAHFGVPLDDDPTSLMFRGITAPADLDGKRLPTLN